MARVKYLQASDLGEEGKPLWERLQRERKVPTANIFTALAHAPQILDQFLSYANAMRGAKLSPKLREMAILTVGHCTASEYEIAHHQSHGLKAGISSEQLKEIEWRRAEGALTESEIEVVKARLLSDEASA